MMKFLSRLRSNRRFRSLQTAIDANEVAQVEEILAEMKADGLLEDVPLNLFLFTCNDGERSGCVRLLLENGWGAALNMVDSLGRGALHLSIENGDLETARVLLDAGADPNIRDRDGVTPLNLCKSFHGTSDIARLLLDAGGNPNLVDKHGKNYLM